MSGRVATRWGRVIDYGLTRAVDVDVRHSGEHYGSDHALVLFRVHHKGKELRLGLWNAERDRDVAAVVRLVDQLLDAYQLDALALTEASDYVAELRRLSATRPWQLLAGLASKPGQREVAWLVRDSVPVERFSSPLVAAHGWTTTRGGHTPPKYLASVRLDGWLWAGVGHRAPSVRWRRLLPVGPVRRVASTIAHARGELRWARRHPGPLVLLGDWNATPATRGRWSPHWVARKARLTVHAPRQGTHR